VKIVDISWLKEELPIQIQSLQEQDEEDVEDQYIVVDRGNKEEEEEE
jgi:hypothetical protein